MNNSTPKEDSTDSKKKEPPFTIDELLEETFGADWRTNTKPIKKK